MNEELKQSAIIEMIRKTYEDLGIAILEIIPAGTCSFKCQIIDGEGLKEVVVTIFLHMTYVNKC